MIKLKPTSWKIMLEVLVKANPTKIQEVPIQFDERNAGESKFNTKQMKAYLKHLLLLFLYKRKKFIKFCIVGGSGALIHFAIVWTLTEAAGLWYMLSTAISIAIVVTWNFTLNSFWTFSQNKDPDSGDYDWHSFYKGNPVQRWWKQSISKIIWNWIPTSSILLDIGCGSSPTITHYPLAIGIDANEAKLDFMRKKMPAGFFAKMPSDDLKFENDYFDYVLCIEVLEHLPNPEETVAEIARVLKSGGEAVIATPNYGRFWWYLAERFTSAKDQHITKFTKRSLDKMCESFGLNLIESKHIAGCDYIGLYRRN